MFEEPTKVFPCDCMGEGIAVTKDHDEEDISEGEVLVQESTDLRHCVESPYISLSFWEFGHHRHGRFSLWCRLKMACSFVFRKKHFWEDMVIMKASHAKNFANHILYLITKGEREKKLGEPIVKDINWPENEVIREDANSESRTLAEDKVVDELIADMDLDMDLEVIEAIEGKHPYFCVQHGGSAACEEANRKNGFTCPKCDQDKIVEEIKSKEEKDV